MLTRTLYPTALMRDETRDGETMFMPVFEIELDTFELERLIVATIVPEDNHFEFVRCQITNRVADLRVFVNLAGTQTWLHDTHNQGAAPEFLGHSLSFPEAQASDIRELVKLAGENLKISRDSLFEVGIPKRFFFDNFPEGLSFEDMDRMMHVAKEDPFAATTDALVWAFFLAKATIQGEWRELKPEIEYALDKLRSVKQKNEDDFFEINDRLEFEIDQRVDRALRNLRDLLDRFPGTYLEDDSLERYLSRFSDDELAEVGMLAYYGGSMFDQRLKLILIEVERRRSAPLP